MGLLKQVALAVVVAFAAHRIFKVIVLLDLGKVIHYHEPGPCHLVPGVEEGSEDLQVMKNGVALITSGIRFPPPGNVHTKNRKSRILKFDFNNPEAGVEEVKIVNANEMPELNPHGISIWEDKDTGKTLVFVVNHPVNDVDYVSIFEYDVSSNSLRHVKSVSHPDFGLLNDVVAVGPDSFYTTKYLHNRNQSLLFQLETLLLIRTGAVIYYDGNDATLMDSGLLMANGINLSPDGKFVYVSGGLDECIKIYKRNQDNGLTFIRDITLGTIADNVNIDIETGDIWTGAHPVGHQVLLHLDNPSAPTPSQVLRIRLRDDKDFVEEVFSEPATRLYASTSADRYKDAILIGTIQHNLMYCQLKHTAL